MTPLRFNPKSWPILLSAPASEADIAAAERVHRAFDPTWTPALERPFPPIAGYGRGYDMRRPTQREVARESERVRYEAERQAKPTGDQARR